MVLKFIRYFLYLCMAITVSTFASENPGEQVNRESVILLHGLARGSGSMSAIEKAFKRQGFHVHNIDYPSTSKNVDQLIAYIDEQYRSCCIASKSTHFVTHSLGGILTRAFLEIHRISNMGRVVMIAPPNQGSEIVDQIGDWGIFEAIFGETGAKLGTENKHLPRKLANPYYEVGIIAGDAFINPVGWALLPSPNDGAVSVESTKLTDMRDFVVVKHSHTFIQQMSDTVNLAISFIKTGKFSSSP